MTYSVTPILGGEFGMVRDDIRYQGGDPSISSMVPSLLFLLQQGQTQIVIDTSFGDVRTVREEIGLLAERDGEYNNILMTSGVEPLNVKTVILTHTHWDHAANIDCFPNAIIYCQRADWEYAFSKEAGYNPKLQESFKLQQHRFALLDGDAEPLPGIRLLATGGHTPGSQIVAVDTDEGTVIICGDEAMTLCNLENNLPVGLCCNVENNRLALQRATSYSNGYWLPCHDYRTSEFCGNPDAFRVRPLQTGGSI